MEKLWNKNQISKEEMNTVNTIQRCYRYFLGAFKDKKINRKKFEQYKRNCIYALDLCYWFYSDKVTNERDFKNWKESYEMYNKIRSKL